MINTLSSLFPLSSHLFPPRSLLLALTSSLLACLLPQAAEASRITETLKLKHGWNGVYLEATPEVADCYEFFKGTAVTKVMLYDGKGLDGTPLINENGQDILQTPVYYYVWNPATSSTATLKALIGGRCYLMYATNKCEKVFIGEPKRPYNYWRNITETNSIMNLVSVSCDPSASVAATAYFGECPSYDSSGKVYTIGGLDESQPTVAPILGSTPKVSNGVAYSLSAKDGGDWPGVISVESSRVSISGGSGSVTIRNLGTKSRKVRMTIVESANPNEKLPPLTWENSLRTNITEDPLRTEVVANQGWTITIDAKAEGTIIFKTIPARLMAGATYAAVLQIDDLGGTAMRVRIPITVLDSAPEKNDFRGLWVGAMALGAVSSIDGNQEPLPAAGIMSLNVIVHVNSNSTSRLLQQAVVAADTNGNYMVYTRDKDVPPFWSVKNRFFTAMMSLDEPVGVEVGSPGFGTVDGTVLTWGVPERARDNPFRHAWHPDHDGRSADYTMDTPTGDDFANYENPVKPELWSITNSLSFKLNGPYVPNADQTMEGDVIWDVGGLVASNTIRTTGRFLIRRLYRNIDLDLK